MIPISIPISVKVPFAGEALTVFKSACDFITHGMTSEEYAAKKIEKLSDDEFQFTQAITLGFFRLLLDGTYSLIDKDLENLISLLSINSKDRGGKGRIDAKMRLLISEDPNELICEAEIMLKGMLARVELPIQKVFSEKIESILTLAIADANSKIVIDDFAQLDTEDASSGLFVSADSVENLDIEALSKIVVSGNLRQVGHGESERKPLWVFLLQLPVNLITFPFNFLRNLVFPT